MYNGRSQDFDSEESVDMQKDEVPLESRMLQKKLAEYKVVATVFFTR